MQNYQLWQGRHRFFFQGKVMTGPKPYAAFLTALLVLAISISSIFTLEFELASQGRPEVLIINLILLAITLFGWAKASFCDPGTVPANSNFIHRTSSSLDQRDQWFMVNRSRLLILKFCKTCDIYRPPRSVHCTMCDTCTLRLDHHCPWLGTCIARNNYIYFTIFVNGASAMSLLNIAGGVYNLWMSRNETIEDPLEQIHQAIKSTPFTAVLVILYFLAGIFPVVLQVYHTFLWTFRKGKTTNESCKSSEIKIDKGNQFKYRNSLWDRLSYSFSEMPKQISKITITQEEKLNTSLTFEKSGGYPAHAAPFRNQEQFIAKSRRFLEARNLNNEGQLVYELNLDTCPTRGCETPMEIMPLSQKKQEPARKSKIFPYQE